MQELSRCSCTLKELSERTGVAKSTLCNILRTLEQLGAVVGDGRGRYRIGPRLSQLAGSDARDEQLRSLLAGPVRDLSRKVDETCTLAVLRGSQRHILVIATGQQALTTRPREDAREDVWRLATGRVLVSHLSPQLRKQLVCRIGLPGDRWDGIETLEALEAKSACVRRGNLALVRDYVPHVVFCASAVLDGQGDPVAALSCSVPAARWKGDHRDRCLSSLAEAVESCRTLLSEEADEQG
jgi:DNA-binding IclR family transcriptional regulator